MTDANGFYPRVQHWIHIASIIVLHGGLDGRLWGLALHCAANRWYVAEKDAITSASTKIDDRVWSSSDHEKLATNRAC